MSAAAPKTAKRLSVVVTKVLGESCTLCCVGLVCKRVSRTLMDGSLGETRRTYSASACVVHTDSRVRPSLSELPPVTRSADEDTTKSEALTLKNVNVSEPTQSGDWRRTWLSSGHDGSWTRYCTITPLSLSDDAVETREPFKGEPTNIKDRVGGDMEEGASTVRDTIAIVEAFMGPSRGLMSRRMQLDSANAEHSRACVMSAIKSR